MEYCNLAASGELTFALQTVMILNHPSTVTLPQFWDHTPNSVLHDSTQSNVYTKKLTLLT